MAAVNRPTEVHTLRALQALEQTELRDVIAALDGGLDATLADVHARLSAGQQQVALLLVGRRPPSAVRCRARGFGTTLNVNALFGAAVLPGEGTAPESKGAAHWPSRRMLPSLDHNSLLYAFLSCTHRLLHQRLTHALARTLAHSRRPTAARRSAAGPPTLHRGALGP